MKSETNLSNEKIKLENEELMIKIANLKKKKPWEYYIKPIIPIAITLIIAIVSTIITNQYNKSQIEITKEKNRVDKELAQINASISFIKLMNEIPSNSLELEKQAKTIIAPALPPETSFAIAIEDLETNPGILEVLIRTYPYDYMNYLQPYLEEYPLFFMDDPFRSPQIDLKLFAFLDETQLLDTFFQFVCAKGNDSPNRINSLINYFEFLYSKEELTHNPAMSNQIKYKLITMIEGTKEMKLKSDISKAASVVFDKYQAEHLYTELAAKYYWENIDISIGEVPKETSVEEYIFLNRFHTDPIYADGEAKSLPVMDQLSESLFTKLSELSYDIFDVDRINTILYSYSDTIKTMPFQGYLQPKQSFELIQLIIKSLKTEERKIEFSMYLGSLSGDNLFRNISQNNEIGKSYAEYIIKWYHENWKQAWYIPKFMHSIVIEYPELKNNIDEQWGLSID